MTRQKGKRFISLLCVCIALVYIGTIGSLSALADSGVATGIDFHIKASLDPDATEQAPGRFLRGLARMLDMLRLSGHTVLQDGQADIKGNLYLNGLSAIDFHMTGWEERLNLVTNLFGKKPVVITPANYIRFLLKMYSYFSFPVQYAGVFTDPYSYIHGIKPALDTWTGLLGGTESRSFSPEDSVGIALQISQALNNEAFIYWREGLLKYVGLDELLTEFFYAVPDWTADLAKEGGLEIKASDQGESWTLGGKTVYTFRQSGNISAWQVDVPEWEGYRLSGKGQIETGESGLQVSMEWELFEDGEPYGYLTVAGQDLPDGKRMQGSGRISVAFGGDGLGMEQSYLAGLVWNQRQEDKKSVLDGQVSFLNPHTQQPVLQVDGWLSWGETQESFQPLTLEDMQGIDLFCMDDITLREFYANAKWPLVRGAIPFLVELPAGFLSGVVDWMDESGMLVTLMDGMGK